MATITNDGFTNPASDTALENVTPDTAGAGYSGFETTAFDVTAASDLCNADNDGGSDIFAASDTPGNAEQTVRATIHFNGSTDGARRFACCARLTGTDATDAQCYLFEVRADGQGNLYKATGTGVRGSESFLTGGFITGFDETVSNTVELVVAADGSGGVDLTASVNSTQHNTHNDASGNSPITGAGSVGWYSTHSGIDIESVYAEDTSSVDTTAFTPMWRRRRAA